MFGLLNKKVPPYLFILDNIDIYNELLYYNLINISKVDFAIRLTNHNQKKICLKKEFIL